MTFFRRSLAGLLVMLPLAANAAEAPKWDVSMTQSALGFAGKQMGAPFTGTIAKFKPEIRFDPAHPELSHVTVDVDVTSIATGDADRDKSVGTQDWFDFANFPAARFASDSFKKTGEGQFEAAGTLTIKGVSVPVVVPFTFTPISASDMPRARVKGTARLDRTAFGLGLGEWKDPGVIANEVTVTFDLVAYKQK